MQAFIDLFRNFFTHKDFLPPADQLPGTLFTPLHLGFSFFCLLLTLWLVFRTAKTTEKTRRTVFTILWAAMLVLEIAKITWETLCGETVRFEYTGILPLYPCSIFLYATPFAIWGRGLVRRAACGYICSLGMLGAAINFVYPANVIGHYSCISFAGFHTLFYHGGMLFCALTMLFSGYHSYTKITRWWELLLPAAPFLAVSVIANAVNLSPIHSDYMFFRLDSFIFAPLGRALPTWLSMLIVYAAYLLIHALPYIPSYLFHRHTTKQKEVTHHGT